MLYVAITINDYSALAMTLQHHSVCFAFHFIHMRISWSVNHNVVIQHGLESVVELLFVLFQFFSLSFSFFLCWNLFGFSFLSIRLVVRQENIKCLRIPKQKKYGRRNTHTNYFSAASFISLHFTIILISILFVLRFVLLLLLQQRITHDEQYTYARLR